MFLLSERFSSHYITRTLSLAEFSGIHLKLTYTIIFILCIHKSSSHHVFLGLISGQKFSHIPYTGRVSSPVWILSWTLRIAFYTKVSPNLLHLNGFSTVWILWCTLRVDIWANFSHSPTSKQFLSCVNPLMLKKIRLPEGFSPAITLLFLIHHEFFDLFWCLTSD